MRLEQIDINDYKGEVDPLVLIPKMGGSFKNSQPFIDIVDLLEKWKYKTALKKVEQMIVEERHVIEALLLKGELYALCDYNHAAVAVFDQVLCRDPENVPAQVMKLIQLEIINASPDELENNYKKLRQLSNSLYKEVVTLVEFIKKYQTCFDFKVNTDKLDLICVFGYFLNEDGSMPEKLQKRLSKVIELAAIYPEATILLSGGAVQNTYCEAIEMKKYLVDKGIEGKRMVTLNQAKDTVGNVIEFMDYIFSGTYSEMCVVTSSDHLPRAWMSLKVGLKKYSNKVNLYGAASQDSVTDQMMEKEIRLDYQTIFRVAGLFEKKDIENYVNN